MAAVGGNKLVALLKPPPLKLSKIGDPEQMLLDWQDYVKTFKRFIEVTKIDGDHTEEHVNCVGCKTAKNIILMVGQKELETLWDHIGNVNDEDSFEEEDKEDRSWDNWSDQSGNLQTQTLYKNGSR